MNLRCHHVGIFDCTPNNEMSVGLLRAHPFTESVLLCQFVFLKKKSVTLDSSCCPLLFIYYFKDKNRPIWRPWEITSEPNGGEKHISVLPPGDPYVSLF